MSMMRRASSIARSRSRGARPQMNRVSGKRRRTSSIASGDGSIPTPLYSPANDAMFAPGPQPTSTTDCRHRRPHAHKNRLRR